MARCSPPIAPGNNPFVDAVYFLGGLVSFIPAIFFFQSQLLILTMEQVGFPIWRKFFADAEVKKVAKEEERKRKLVAAAVRRE